MTQRTDTYDDEQWQLVPKEMTQEMDAVFSIDRYNAFSTSQTIFERVLAAAPTPPVTAPSVEPVGKVRVTNEGYGMVLHTYVAYALPEGIHDVYATPPSAEGARDAAFEEAAQVCESITGECQPMGSITDLGKVYAESIRALKSNKEA